MFGLRAHIDVTTCDIYGIRILFSLPMLWESALLSLLVRFTNSDIRIMSLLIPPDILLLNPLLSRVAGVLTQIPDRGSLSHSGQAARSLAQIPVANSSLVA